MHRGKWTPRYKSCVHDIKKTKRVIRLHLLLFGHEAWDLHWLIQDYPGALGGPGPALAALCAPGLFWCTRSGVCTSTGCSSGAQNISVHSEFRRTPLISLTLCSPWRSLICSLLLSFCHFCDLLSFSVALSVLFLCPVVRSLSFLYFVLLNWLAPTDGVALASGLTFLAA